MKKEFVITYVEKIYYKPVTVSAQDEEEALDIFNSTLLGELDPMHVQKIKLEIEEV